MIATGLSFEDHDEEHDMAGSPAAPAGDPHGLAGLLRRHAVETERYVATFGAGHGLHRTDLNALAVIMDADRTHEPMTPGRLSTALHLSPPATSALIDRLEQAGHLRRTRSATDRRQVDLRITDSALAVGAALFGPLAEHVRAAIERYTEPQQALIARFLEDVSAAVTAAADDRAPVTGGHEKSR
ncbi:MarR family transcriptional regulator [Amycolatopsis rhabdoformis]|uniref:MarR family transcriptional regulator n=1 Tax=Amycolatopsis rhabdoformis TaxID=1448059 RepID=A0ABZ1IIL0_9PSEU|nr:MarR family transcriptional regulator [Amycolatopsis rhabdoformis]WSE34087.1 MarR family transcriptional regulator [Amycolatopsis rhabdoformis]